MRTITLLLIALAAGAVSLPGLSADASSNRTARVAAGEKVQLVDSGRSAAQWAAARPGGRDLRPKVRGTFD